MSARFRRGLVVGKFAPLHKGHELVIRRALADCDQVSVLSYSKPELPGCPPEARARWLEALFPSAQRLVLTDALAARWPAGPGALPANDAPDDDHRRFVARVCVEHLGGPVDAVFTSEDYGEGFAAALTAYFQAPAAGPDSRACTVTHVLVDRARQALPISGTMIRSDVHRHRQWLSPEVYASFVQRVCILGGESSGKSTLAATLARVCQTAQVPEYGRTLWDARGGALVFQDMRHIAEHQLALEDQAARTAHRWLFCDTSPLTTLFYSQDLFGRVDPALEEMSRRPYPFTLLCAPDFPFVQDGTRRDPAFRTRQHAFYLRELQRTGAAYTVVGGDVDARVRQTLAWLDEDGAERVVAD
jgi:HTH-type transcriptional repressor of NAD biosynthesis genes